MKLLLCVFVLSSLVAWTTSQLHCWYLKGTIGMCYGTFFEEIPVMSVTICATLCRTRRCASFTFEERLCRLYDAGLDTFVLGPRQYTLYDCHDNLAAFKSTTAAPHAHPKVKEMGNDCDMTTFYHSAPYEYYAWYNVDLGRTYSISLIRIFPYYQSWIHYNRFHNVEVKVGNEPAVAGDASAYTLLGHYTGPYDNSSCCSVNFIFPTVMARYVHIRRTTADYPPDDFLIFDEIEVYP